MNNFFEKVKSYLSKCGDDLSNNVYLNCISDAFSAILPLTIFGSLFALAINIPIGVIRSWIEQQGLIPWLSLPSVFTIDIISVYVVFLVAYQYGKKRLPNSSINMGINALFCFLIITPLFRLTEGNSVINYISLEWLGAKGLFVALVTGIVSAKMFEFIIKKNWVIKLSGNVSMTIFESFLALLPTVVSGSFFLLIAYSFSFTRYNNIHELMYQIIQIPLSSLGNSVWTVIIFTIVTSVLWWFGLHGGQIVGAISMTIFLPLSLENLSLHNSGEELRHIYTTAFESVYNFGGAGMTISLTLMMLFSKSTRYKQLGRLSIVSNLFNINEPTIFGFPIILNPVMLIPFILSPLISMLIAYYATYLGIVPKIIGYQLPWTIPPVISGFLQGGYRVATLQIVLLVITFFIYLPFFKKLENIEKEPSNLRL